MSDEEMRARWSRVLQRAMTYMDETQSELEASAGVARKTISDLYLGKTVPSMRTIRRLRDALHLPPDIHQAEAEMLKKRAAGALELMEMSDRLKEASRQPLLTPVRLHPADTPELSERVASLEARVQWLEAKMSELADTYDNAASTETTLDRGDLEE